MIVNSSCYPDIIENFRHINAHELARVLWRGKKSKNERNSWGSLYASTNETSSWKDSDAGRPGDGNVTASKSILERESPA